MQRMPWRWIMHANGSLGCPWPSRVRNERCRGLPVWTPIAAAPNSFDQPPSFSRWHCWIFEAVITRRLGQRKWRRFSQLSTQCCMMSLFRGHRTAVKIGVTVFRPMRVETPKQHWSQIIPRLIID